MDSIAAVVVAYLLGSVSFAVIVSRAFALPDPRSYGSKNPGATNVLRSGRKLAAILTLVGDAAKGVAAVLLAGVLVPGAPHVEALAAIAVVAGHMYPVFHRFAGGKGVSTAAGVLLALNLWIGLGALASWVLIAVFFRISSLAALVATVSAPVFAAILFDIRHPFVWGVAVIGLLVIWRHRANIANLIAGTEGRIGERRTGAASQGPGEQA